MTYSLQKLDQVVVVSEPVQSPLNPDAVVKLGKLVGTDVASDKVMYSEATVFLCLVNIVSIQV